MCCSSIEANLQQMVDWMAQSVQWMDFIQNLALKTWTSHRFNPDFHSFRIFYILFDYSVKGSTLAAPPGQCHLSVAEFVGWVVGNKTNKQSPGSLLDFESWTATTDSESNIDRRRRCRIIIGERSTTIDCRLSESRIDLREIIKKLVSSSAKFVYLHKQKPNLVLPIWKTLYSLSSCSSRMLPSSFDWDALESVKWLFELFVSWSCMLISGQTQRLPVETITQLLIICGQNRTFLEPKVERKSIIVRIDFWHLCKQTTSTTSWKYNNWLLLSAGKLSWSL